MVHITSCTLLIKGVYNIICSRTAHHNRS